ncbi:tetratricopeptide repeat protein [bacterium]|nr:tetratricopeptide repeat protein [bacterium]
MFDNFENLLNDNFSLFKLEKEQTERLQLKEGERRVVCILFAHVKDFAPLLQKFDAEQVQLISSKTVNFLAQSITRFGGHIDKIENEMIMALFGAIKASESDTERAILTALEMVENLQKFKEFTLTKISQLQNIDLTIQIGINTGLVTTGKVGAEREADFTVYGDAVNVASRMSAIAKPNQILIPLETQKIIQNKFDFECIGKIKVKGKTKPIEVFTVKNAVKEKFWQENLKQKYVFVGREKELKILEDCFEKAKKQNSKLVSVGIKGLVGTGKSRIVYEFLKVERNNFLPTENLLFGEADPYNKSSYKLFTFVLKRFCKINEFETKEFAKEKIENAFENLASFLEAEEDKIKLKKTIPFLAYLLGIDYAEANLKELQPSSLQISIKVSLKFFIEKVAQKSNSLGFPLVIILDDLHWIDEVSEDFLNFFLKTFNFEEKQVKVLLILLYRNDYESKRLNFEDFTEIELQPLQENFAKQLIQLKTNEKKLPLEIKNTLFEKSAGNPFFIEEFLKMVSENKNLKIDEFPIPDSVNSIVLSRLDKLEKDLNLLLQKASVIGRTFSLEILEQVEKRFNPNTEIKKGLEVLCQKDWIVEVGENSYSFKHLITQEVCYNTLLLHNRKILHNTIAEVLEMNFPENLYTIYKHYKFTDNLEKKIEFGKKAGEKLKEDFQNNKAIEVFNELLTNLGFLEQNNALRFDILVKIGKILQLTGDWKKSEEILNQALELALRIEDKLLEGRAKLSLGWTFYLKNDFDKAIKLFENALEIFEKLNDKGGIAASLGNIGIITYLRSDYGKAMELYKRQLEFCEELGDKNEISRVFGNIGLVYLDKGENQKAKKYFYSCLKIKEELADKSGIFKAFLSIGMLYFAEKNFEKSFEFLEKGKKIALEIGDLGSYSTATGNLGILYREVGDFKKAEECYTEQMKICEKLGSKRELAIVTGNFGILFLDKKDHKNSLEALDKAIEIGKPLGIKTNLCSFLVLKSQVFFELGNFEKAQIFAKESLEIGEEIQRQEVIFGARILLQKISFELAPNPQEKLAAQNELKKMLAEAKNDEEKATLNYELSKLVKDFPAYKEEGLRLFRQLYNQAERFDYLQKIKDLEK